MAILTDLTAMGLSVSPRELIGNNDAASLAQVFRSRIASGMALNENKRRDLFAAMSLLGDKPMIPSMLLPQHVFLLHTVRAGDLLTAASSVGLEPLYRTTVGAALSLIPKLAETDGAAIKAGADPMVSLMHWVEVVRFIGWAAKVQLLLETKPGLPPRLHPKIEVDLDAIDKTVIEATKGGAAYAPLNSAFIMAKAEIHRLNEKLKCDFQTRNGDPTVPFPLAVNDIVDTLRRHGAKPGMSARELELVIDRLLDETEARRAHYWGVGHVFDMTDLPSMMKGSDISRFFTEDGTTLRAKGEVAIQGEEKPNSPYSPIPSSRRDHKRATAA
jgi:hypothetical protein